MTIDIAKENDIRRLHDVEKWRPGTIVAELGVHSDVVERVLDPGAERPLVLAPRPSLVDPFEAFIDETLKAHPRLRATRLFDMVRMRGYEGGIAILRRHVAEVRPTPRGEVYLRVERLIGEQAQVDWAHVGSLAVTGAVALEAPVDARSDHHRPRTGRDHAGRRSGIGRRRWRRSGSAVASAQQPHAEDQQGETHGVIVDGSWP